jgi:hypothetical protein
MLQKMTTVAVGLSLWAVPVYAQSSTERVLADIDVQYQLMKQVMRKEISPPTEPREATFDLACIGGDPSFHSKNQLVTALGVLAGEIVQASDALQWAGYPATVWERSLTDIERRQLDRIRQSGHFDGGLFEDQVRGLTNKLAAYKKSHPQVTEINWEPSCGGHGFTLQIVTRPPGRKVQYIEALYYNFCVAQDIDPKTFNECNLWRTVQHGEDVSFEGAYWYRVERGDGSYSEPQRKDFSDTPETAEKWTVN